MDKNLDITKPQLERTNFASLLTLHYIEVPLYFNNNCHKPLLPGNCFPNTGTIRNSSVLTDNLFLM